LKIDDVQTMVKKPKMPHHLQQRRPSSKGFLINSARPKQVTEENPINNLGLMPNSTKNATTTNRLFTNVNNNTAGSTTDSDSTLQSNGSGKLLKSFNGTIKHGSGSQP
jgi:hypothetical protein